MIEVCAALKIVLDSVRPLGPEAVRVTESLDRVLAQDIRSDSDIPGFDNSAMDGYAVKAADIKRASGGDPAALNVVGELKAGDTAQKLLLKNNQAIRIMTGAAIPKGADSVVMVEDTRLEKGPVRIYKEVKPGENIRRKGEDIKKGELVIPCGTLLKSAHIGILASLGKSRVKVIRKPRVGILATGDEVVDIGHKLSPGKLRNSNTYTLYGQVLECGGAPLNLGIARDEPRELEAKIKKGVLSCDLILTSGGVSVGVYDLVKDILARIGANIRFWQVAMRPGKPLVFGTVKDKLIFGLPGNPVSSMVSFEVFVRPAILKMLGQRDDPRKEAQAQVEEDIKKKPGFRYFLRANTRWHQGRYLTRTTGPQGSAILKSMALANSLIILPEDKEFVPKGKRVTVRFLN